MVFILIVISAALTRILPHAWNLAPVTAIAIVAAMYLPAREALLMTFVIRFISDLIIGFFAWPLMIAVYASHFFGVVMGLWVRKSVTSSLPPSLKLRRTSRVPSPLPEREGVRSGIWPRVIIAPVFSSIVFFLVTNFAFLYPTYTHDLSGIISAYVNGLPFLRGTLSGDVLYTSALVGSVELALLWRRKAAAGKILRQISL